MLKKMLSAVVIAIIVIIAFTIIIDLNEVPRKSVELASS